MTRVVGVGVDICSVERLSAAIARPQVLERLFNPNEQHGSPLTLAGRFAAKEALAKALGAPPGLVWLDCVVTKAASGEPGFELRGTVAARAAELGIETVHLSISHDAGVAIAMVVCESA